MEQLREDHQIEAGKDIYIFQKCKLTVERVLFVRELFTR